jgi:RNA polymerase sigma-70 factor (ECF subfamily)
MDSVSAPELSSEPAREPARCPLCEEAQAARAALSARIGDLVRAHRQHLARIARAEGLAGEDVFDAVQEAFYKLIELPDAARLSAAPEEARRVLGALTRNVARNRRRLHAVARPHASGGATLDQLPARGPTAEERLLAAAEEGRLAGCIGRLADVQRAVVSLRMLEELPGEDVARMLDITPGHVAVLLHRAKASLSTCMATEAT